MRQIVYNKAKPLKIVDFYEALSCYHQQGIVAYITKQGTGIAILQQKENKEYGFIYHKYLIEGQTNPKYTFEARNPKNALKLAMDANREVILFEDYKDFVNFAANYSKL